MMGEGMDKSSQFDKKKKERGAFRGINRYKQISYIKRRGIVEY